MFRTQGHYHVLRRYVVITISDTPAAFYRAHVTEVTPGKLHRIDSICHRVLFLRLSLPFQNTNLLWAYFDDGYCVIEDRYCGLDRAH
jgi:hypothetical protein